MKRYGKLVFFVGVAIAVIMGAIVSWDPGSFCNLDSDNPPETIWSYPVLSFIIWAYSVPLGFIISAIGILLYAKVQKSTIVKFALGMLGTYLFISTGNGPMPHVPPLFGIGGILILSFYFMILWQNASRFKEHIYQLSGYTFMVIGFWFTCGLGSRNYQPALGAGESPIDIMTYFVLAMFFFWMNERRQVCVTK